MYGNDIIITNSGITEIITPTMPNYNHFRLTGVATLSGNVSISYDPAFTPTKWDVFIFDDESTITLGTSTVTIFGTQLTRSQCLGKGVIYCMFDGSSWVVRYYSSVTDKASGIGGATKTVLGNAGTTIFMDVKNSDNTLVLTGSPTLTSSWTVQTSGTPTAGDMQIVFYKATTITGVNTITILGQLLTPAQALAGNSIIISTFDGTSWATILIDPNPIAMTPITAIMTKAQANSAVAAATLTQCGFYLITGVHPTLYDDGTTSGTDIILQATDKNEFSHKGYGKFWNPKYNQAVSGFGIWSNRNTWTATLTGLVFNANEAITADNGATGFLVGVLADNLFVATAGNWAAATSITGDVTGATATLAGITLKTYTIGQKVIWGHYVWENVKGNVGAATDVLTLDAEWLKLPYTATDYNVTWDEIEFDFTNNWITSRYESEADNRVSETYATFGDFAYTYHAISVFQWGNHYNNSSGKGIGGNKVDESYAEFCNFQGNYVVKNIIVQKSKIKNNIIINGSIFHLNFFKESYFESSVLNNNSSIKLNELCGSYVSQNTLSGSFVYNNTLNGTSLINNNTLSDTASISSNILQNNSSINNNVLKTISSISTNNLICSLIDSNILTTNDFNFIIAEKATITIAVGQVATFYPIFAATYTKNIISTVDAKNVLITWSAIGVSTPLDLATGVTPV